MKKILLIFILIFIPLFTYADSKSFNAADVAKAEQNGNFIITSDVRHFNPLTGIYDLNGHVYVNFPTHGEQVIIKADTAQVKLYSQEVTARGNIVLNFKEMLFNCDNVYVKHKDRTAYVNGNIYFKHENNNIRADSATYCWKTKLAVFKNASLNGASKKATISYDVMNKRFVN